MSSPSQADEGPNWAELAPNLREQEDAVAAVAQQVRILFAAGKDASQVCNWLQQIGFSNEEAEAFLAALTKADRQSPPIEMTITSGPWDFGGVFAPRENPLEKRRERKTRQEKSKRLEQAEPNPALDLGGESYAQVVAREAHRKEGGARLFTWIAIAVVSLPILAILVFVVLAAFGVL
jgi:hypothetical protein